MFEMFMRKLETRRKSVYHWEKMLCLHCEEGVRGSENRLGKRKKPQYRIEIYRNTECTRCCNNTCDPPFHWNYNFINLDSKRIAMFTASTRQTTQMLYKT